MTYVEIMAKPAFSAPASSNAINTANFEDCDWALIKIIRDPPATILLAWGRMYLRACALISASLVPHPPAPVLCALPSISVFPVLNSGTIPSYVTFGTSFFRRVAKSTTYESSL